MPAHVIDLETWPRREHLAFFRRFGQPHFGLCTEVDVAPLHAAVRRRGASFTVAMTYLMARVANAIPEFRLRIRGETVVEHDVVHPSTTILGKGDLFGFLHLDYAPEFAQFARDAAVRLQEARARPSLSGDEGRDDLLFMTSIPWVTFTSVMHPMPGHPDDAFPRFAWGRFHRDGEALNMPLAVQAHHGLVDGVHVGRFYEGFCELAVSAEDSLG